MIFVHQEYDFSRLRPAGAPIRGFGGVAAGEGVLRQLLNSLQTQVLQPAVGQPLSITHIVDLFNLIGVAVVAGNVRQTAEIAFGPAHSDEYIDLKNYKRNAHRGAYGWASNNSGSQCQSCCHIFS